MTADANTPPPAAPTITSFVATPKTVSVGGSASLTAVFSGGLGTVDHGVGTLISGNPTSTGAVAPSTTYTLTVTNSAGVAVTAQVTVSAGFFTTVGSLITPREEHTATLLKGTGKVLIAGGSDNSGQLGSAELYDPSTKAFTSTGSLNVRRAGHTATLLSNGKILIVGGFGAGAYQSSAELYDPSTGLFTLTGNLMTARSYATATLLSNGMVLVIGGSNVVNGSSQYLQTAELYDPSSGKFTTTYNLVTARMRHQAVLLSTKKVLVIGGMDLTGNLKSAELFDPASGQFVPTGSLVTDTCVVGSQATLLLNGQVLVSGCSNEIDIYDPTTGTFSRSTSSALSPGIVGATATLLPNGMVLLAGGNGVASDLYDPATGSITASGDMAVSLTSSTAALLLDGTVLIAGGSAPGGYWPKAQLFQ
jgi:hypothetical protein